MEVRTFVAAVALLATTILLHSSLVAAAGTAHIVGGSTGWTIPANTSFYSDWSSSQTIAAGDTLVFNFPTGFHTVMEVPKLNFDSCSTTKQIGSTFKNGPATVTVTSGTHYYICSIPQHCSAGMKMAITVAAAAVAPSVSGAPAPKASVPTSASPSSATAPAKGAAGTAKSPAPVAAHKVAGPTSSSPVPATTPVSRSHAWTGGPTASSPAPTADKKSAPSPTSSVPSVPRSAANPPAAPGPSGSGNGSNSSSALRGAAGLVFALLTVATVSFLL